MLLFLGMHQEPKKQKPPDIRRLLSAEILASELKFRTSSGDPAHGTVASPARLPDSVKPESLLMLQALYDKCMFRVKTHERDTRA